MSCDFCTDSDGESCYPLYGLAPHTHSGEEYIGTTRFLPKEEWPDNFKVSDESRYHGIYWCGECGEGKPDT